MIEPKILKAGRCFGSCVSVTKPNISPYSHLYKNLFKHNQNNQETKLCCVPSSFQNAVLMFYNKVDDVVIKMYEDVVVNNCECR